MQADLGPPTDAQPAVTRPLPGNQTELTASASRVSHRFVKIPRSVRSARFSLQSLLSRIKVAHAKQQSCPSHRPCRRPMAACGSSSTAPSGESTGSSVTSTAYMGSVQLPGGVTGLLLARATPSSESLEPPSGWFARWFTFIEPGLAAQGPAASGELTLDNRTAVVLSGTYSAGTFQLAGSGYSVTASASGGSLSGTVTAPQGTGTVSPMSSGAPAGSIPANPDGYYFGDYSVAVDGFFDNYWVATGLPDGCVRLPRGVFRQAEGPGKKRRCSRGNAGCLARGGEGHPACFNHTDFSE